jgi:hypothetical protein
MSINIVFFIFKVSQFIDDKLKRRRSHYLFYSLKIVTSYFSVELSIDTGDYFSLLELIGEIKIVNC